MAPLTDRFGRQAEIVPAGRLSELRVTVIGVGAIGRQVALQLGSIGVRDLTLIDFDSVELTNVTTQGYRPDQIGSLKVEATAGDVLSIDPGINVNPVCDRFRPRHDCGEVVFACVDSIAARAAIWKHVRSRCVLFLDGRMRGEVIRMLAIDDPPKDQHYESTLFDPSEAHSGSCTSAGTVYTANLAASLMVHQLTRFLRRIPVDRDQSLNLLASELVLA